MPILRRPLSTSAFAILAATTILGSGCITRTVRNTFYEDAKTRIVLVQEKRSGRAIERDYAHPLQIAPVRMAHILSRLDVRVETKKSIQRMPAIPTEALYEIADHLSNAFGQADPNQHIVVYYKRRDKRFGIFDRNYLTSFLVFATGDSMFIHLSKVDWEIQKTGRREKLPEPGISDETDAFRVVASTGMMVANPNTVAVDWVHSVFKKPSRTHIAPGGKVVRRTILMEAPEEPEPQPGEAVGKPIPASLSGATLRALADLEDERANGEVTEADYNARRRRILEADPASK
jgi:hypothetical protein